MNIKNYKLSFLILSFNLLFSTIYAQVDDNSQIKKIKDKFGNFYSNTAQQKVFLHINKSSYNTGEIIWFKAYLLNAVNHIPDTISTNLYVEILNKNKRLIDKKLLKLKNGFTNGDFYFSDTIESGEYQIRAYTNLMKNIGSHYFYSQTIYINNPKVKYFNKPLYKVAKKIKKKLHNISIQFFPEGGSFVENMEAKLAIKAVNMLGNGVDIEGYIEDNKGNKISSFKTDSNGIGVLLFKPETYKKYRAIAINKKGKKQKFKLQAAIKKGYTMLTKIDKNKINVKIKSNLYFAEDKIAKTVIIIGQTRGKIYYSKAKLIEKDSVEFIIDKSTFPVGVTHLSLFNGRGQLFCERLVYIENNKKLLISILQEKKQYKPKDKIEFKIRVTDKKGNPVKTNLSLSVYKSSDTKETPTDINNYLQFQSDLYFSNKLNTNIDLDNMMITQKWKKFNWDSILVKNPVKIKYKRENKIEINGHVTRELIKFNSSDVLVQLTIMSEYNDVYKTTTNKHGKYHFENIDYNDTIEIKLESKFEGYKKKGIIHYKEKKLPEIIFNVLNVSNLEFYAKRIKKKRKKKYNPVDINTDGRMRLHQRADQTIVLKEGMHYSSIADVLSGKVPGLTIGENGANMRGNSSPLFLVDGVPTSFDTAQSINPSTIEFIEILKSPGNLGVYGSRASAGVIAIYTRRGYNFTRGELNLKIQGYYSAKKFNVPKYDKEKNKKVEDNRKNIYWNPSIKTNDKGEAKVSFYGSDISGKYKISIMGVSYKGLSGSAKKYLFIEK